MKASHIPKYALLFVILSVSALGETNRVADLMYGSHHEPSTLVVSNTVYVSGCSSNGVAILGEFGEGDGYRTEVHTFAGGPDDHNNFGILDVTGKVPVVLMTDHSGLSRVFWKRGTTPGNYRSWGTIQSTPTQGYDNAQVYWRTNDEAYVFTRQYDSNWAAIKTTDWFSTVQATYNVFQFGYGDRGYMNSIRLTNSSTLRCGFYGHALSSAFRGVYYCEIDLASGDIKKVDGTVLGNVVTKANLPIAVSDLSLVFSISDTNIAVSSDRISDAPYPEYIYTTSTNSGMRYFWYRRHDGTNWTTPSQICDLGEVFGYSYRGGGNFPSGSPGGVFYVCKGVTPTQWELQRYLSTDGGVTWGKTILATAPAGRKYVRPTGLPLGAPFQVIVVDIEYYADDTYTEYQSDVRAFTDSYTQTWGRPVTNKVYDFITVTSSQKPQVLVSGGTVYVTGSSSTGKGLIAAFGEGNGARTELFTFEKPDNHNTFSLLNVTNKVPVVVATDHDGAERIYWRRGTTAGDFTNYQALQQTTTTIGANYTLSYWRTNDEAYVFYRGYQTNWSIAKTTNWFSTLNVSTILWKHTGGQSYMDAVHIPGPYAGKLRCGLYNDTHATVYYAEIDLDTGDITKDDGTYLANFVTKDNLPLWFTNFSPVYTPASLGNATGNRVSDGPDPEFMFIHDGKYKYSKYSGGSWTEPVTVCDRGGYFGYSYTGGGNFPMQTPGGVFYVSTGTNGVSWNILRYNSSDGGQTWTPTILATAPGTRKYVVPVPLSQNDPYQLVFCDVEYLGPTYNEFYSDAIALVDDWSNSGTPGTATATVNIINLGTIIRR